MILYIILKYGVIHNTVLRAFFFQITVEYIINYYISNSYYNTIRYLYTYTYIYIFISILHISVIMFVIVFSWDYFIPSMKLNKLVIIIKYMAQIKFKVALMFRHPYLNENRSFLYYSNYIK